MNEEAAILNAIPADPQAAFIAADWLEERGDARGELLRVVSTLTRGLESADRPALEERLRSLLVAGIRPAGPYREVRLGGGVGLRLAWVPPGTFLMGSPADEAERWEDEGPQHRVTLTRGFWMGVYPVTQAQWQAVTGSNPSHFKGPDRPVESVSWQDCQAFCRALSQRTGEDFRLPTEAEWEYACRAGTTSTFHFGDSIDTDLANYHGSEPYGPRGRPGSDRRETTPVGAFLPNGWGLYDMHGNVWEWCSDWFDARYYPVSPSEDPEGPATGDNRTVRGGGWYVRARLCRAAVRDWCGPRASQHYIGLRVLSRPAAGT